MVNCYGEAKHIRNILEIQATGTRNILTEVCGDAEDISCVYVQYGKGSQSRPKRRHIRANGRIIGLAEEKKPEADEKKYIAIEG